MNKNTDSQKAKSPRKSAAKTVSSRAPKKHATAPKTFRYTTWMKCVLMLLGIVGISLVLLGTYGTFRAFLHQTQVMKTTQGSEHVAPRGPDGSRTPVGPSVEESQEVREALSAAEESVKHPGARPDMPAIPHDPDGTAHHTPQSGATPPTSPVPPTSTTLPTSPEPSSPSTPQKQSPTIDPKHPKMVIVIDDIGENLADVRTLLSLDFPVTFAIWPHATHAKKAAMLIYAEGKEIILHQPMQPINDKVDAGEGALYVGMTPQEIRATLQANLALVPHAVGLNNHMGSRFTQDRGILTVCDVLKERGLFALDSLTIAGSVFYAEAQKKGLKSARRNVFLDAVSGKENVLFELHRAESIAKQRGLGIAIGHPFATTLSGLQTWSKTRDKNITIVRLQDIVQ